MISHVRRAALVLSLFGAVTQALADAPEVLRNQVAGYYRHAVGDAVVTALHDGQIKLDTKLLKGASPQRKAELLARMFRDNPTPTAVNAFLVHLGGKLVLVDAGAGKLFGPTLGQVLSNLKAAGYEPSQVDAVLLTHLHGDHVGGLVAEGQAVFPNATLYVSGLEARHWLSPEKQAQAPEGARQFFQMAQDSTAPYAKAGRLKMMELGAEVLPGLKAVMMPGHTPGHTGFMLESKGRKLLIWGDIVHNAAVQFAQPTVTIEFDTDPAKALASRRTVFKWVSKESVPVAGAHLPFPGIGNVRADGQGRYTYVPIDFSPTVVTP